MTNFEKECKILFQKYPKIKKIVYECLFEILKENKEKRKEEINQQLASFKNFCSWKIKYEMLSNALKIVNTTFLLDLACGVGNDLNRWTKLGLKRVIGIDYDPEQINEAINRIKQYRRKGGKNVPNISYILGSASDKQLVQKALNYRKVKLITNNFALNHFFKNKETINEFFSVISDSLQKGGIFIGTAMDGDIVAKAKDQTEPDNLYYLKKNDTDNSYQYSINTLFFENNLITEYYIFKKQLVEIAEEHHLVPIIITPGISPIFNFKDYPGSEEGGFLTQFYFGFSFVKI